MNFLRNIQNIFSNSVAAGQGSSDEDMEQEDNGDANVRNRSLRADEEILGGSNNETSKRILEMTPVKSIKDIVNKTPLLSLNRSTIVQTSFTPKITISSPRTPHSTYKTPMSGMSEYKQKENNFLSTPNASNCSLIDLTTPDKWHTPTVKSTPSLLKSALKKNIKQTPTTVIQSKTFLLTPTTRANNSVSTVKRLGNSAIKSNRLSSAKVKHILNLTESPSVRSVKQLYASPSSLAKRTDPIKSESKPNRKSVNLSGIKAFQYTPTKTPLKGIFLFYFFAFLC